jgi:F-type H+-transporting ATPase subunit epsilon
MNLKVLLPHRLDRVAALTSGILCYETKADGEVFGAVDEGVLVKSGAVVLSSDQGLVGQFNDAVGNCAT